MDDPRQSALFLGATLLLARSELTTPLRFAAPEEADPAALAGALARGGTVAIGGLEFEPCWAGLDSRYHMYVRAPREAAVMDGPREAPAVAIGVLEEPAPSGWYTTAPEVTLEGFAADGDDGPLRLELRVGGGAWEPYAGPVRLGAEGAVLVEARVSDALGRTGTADLELNVDTTPPVSRAVVKDLGASVEITLHAEDAVSGVERIQWEGPGTFWGTFQEAFVRAIGEEDQVIEYAATDRAGNEEARRRLVIPGRSTTGDARGTLHAGAEGASTAEGARMSADPKARTEKYDGSH